jgi:hypothetical protein
LGRNSSAWTDFKLITVAIRSWSSVHRPRSAAQLHPKQAGHERKENPVPIIEQVGAREILDSRGNPTIEV